MHMQLKISMFARGVFQVAVNTIDRDLTQTVELAEKTSNPTCHTSQYDISDTRILGDSVSHILLAMARQGTVH